MAPELTLDNARIVFIEKFQSFASVANKVVNGEVMVSGYKLIIMLIGRGNAWQPDKVFFKGLEKFIEVVKNRNDHCVIVLGVTLPSVDDTRPMIRTFGFCNDKIVARCAGNLRLEHARPGRALLGPHGPIKEYFDELGNINEYGGDVISRALERKIYSAKLFQRVEEL